MLEDLIKIIRERKKSKADNSYTKQLISSGLPKCIDKLQEEFDELKDALNEDKSNIVHETADVLYHLLVSLEAANIKFEDVVVELENRKKQSGIEEKKSR
jgi:phosphoribosyl-ATP pyrophosphohydrolase